MVKNKHFYGGRKSLYNSILYNFLDFNFRNMNEKANNIWSVLISVKTRMIIQAGIRKIEMNEYKQK